MRKFALLTLVGTLAGGGAAKADIFVSGGAVASTDYSFRSSSPTGTLNGTVDVRYELGAGWRHEAETSGNIIEFGAYYSKGDVTSSVTPNAGPAVPVTPGEMKTYVFEGTYMWRVAQLGRVRPFVGLGGGLGVISFSDGAIDTAGDETTDADFTYHAVAGASYMFSETLEFYYGVKYRGWTSGKLVGPNSATGKSETEFDANAPSVFAGVRF